MEEAPSNEHIYEWHEYVENLDHYRPGGYHPVHLGDLYSNERYQVVHKLGFGSYSTVWLARDLHLNRYVTLKIVVARASGESSESRILRHLRQTVSGDSDSCITSLRDEFYIDGPNGRHLCLATEPAACSVADSKDASLKWMFPLEIARAISAQTILALQTIHSSGVIHGDLYTKNLLLALPDIHNMSTDDIYHRFLPPHKTEVERYDGQPIGPEVPRYSVWPANTVTASDKVSDPRVRICDFGASWLHSDPPKEDLQTPVVFLPPEATFAKDQLGFPADIWTLACSLYEILGERPLFECVLPDVDYIIAEMVSCLGLLPRPWWDAWRARDEFFAEDGSWRTDMSRIHDSKSRPLLLRIQRNGRKDPEFSAVEIESLEKLLRAMLEYEPSKRATIAQIVESDWMVQWGLPAIRKFNIHA